MRRFMMSIHELLPKLDGEKRSLLTVSDCGVRGGVSRHQGTGDDLATARKPEPLLLSLILRRRWGLLRRTFAKDG